MAAQQQQRVAQANAVAANISALQRNNTSINNANMKGRQRAQNIPKQPQLNTNAMRNNQFKNFNSSMLSNNYQLAAATLAAANTQFLQQVVVSFIIQAGLTERSFFADILPFFILGSKTCDA
jgi:hypothetical protein